MKKGKRLEATRYSEGIKTVNNLIKMAIQARRVLKLSTHSISYFVEPHAFGEDHAGHLVLLSYVNAHVNFCGQTNGWKEFKVSKAICIEETLDSFIGARPGYKRNDGGLGVCAAEGLTPFFRHFRGSFTPQRGRENRLWRVLRGQKISRRF